MCSRNVNVRLLVPLEIPDQWSDSVLILQFLFIKEVPFGLELNKPANVYPYHRTLNMEIFNSA